MTTNYNTLYSKLKARLSVKSREMVLMPDRDVKYWLTLPQWADMYIRPCYEMITDIEGLIEFVHHFLIEYSETTLEGKKLCIEVVIFPIYESLTGRKFDVNYFKAYGV